MKNILLLHGALGAKDQLAPLASALSDSYSVHTLSFSGHGGEPFNSESFTIPGFADDVLRWMDENKMDAIDIFGYSMGGYVALYIAKNHPARIGKIFTLATKFHWDEATAQKEIKMLDASKIEEKVPAFADMLRSRHQPDRWKKVLAMTAEMMIGLGKENVLQPDDYAAIESEVTISIGDRDKMVTLEETIDVYRKLQKARLLVIPSTPHPLEQVSIPRLAFEIKQFFK